MWRKSHVGAVVVICYCLDWISLNLSTSTTFSIAHCSPLGGDSFLFPLCLHGAAADVTYAVAGVAAAGRCT